MPKEYDNTNRLALFATNARGKKAPTHSGTITVHPDLLEENDDGTYTFAITAWTHEEGHVFGVASSNAERVEEREAYLATRKPKTSAKAPTTKKK
jgi:hypothetical protein